MSYMCETAPKMRAKRPVAGRKPMARTVHCVKLGREAEGLELGDEPLVRLTIRTS